MSFGPFVAPLWMDGRMDGLMVL